VVREDQTEGDARRLALRLRSARRARCVVLWDDGGARITGARFAGRPTVDLVRFSPETDERLLKMMTGDRTPSIFRARFCGAFAGEIDVELRALAGAPIKLRIVEVVDGLPDPPVAARPLFVYPRIDSDVTLVTRARVF